MWNDIFTARKLSLWQGNDFTDVSVCPRREGIPDRDSPRQRPPYGKERAVRILLECILVANYWPHKKVKGEMVQGKHELIQVPC